jgi:hypothetical protein
MLMTARANEYLRNNGMAVDCDVDEFLAAADPEFSDTLREAAGSLLSEFEEHDYEDWLADLRDALLVIDTDEEQPFGGQEDGQSARV